VLTPNALDRCIGDAECKDWVHRVRKGNRYSVLCPKIVFMCSLCNENVFSFRWN
jgi:hypothetical protein